MISMENWNTQAVEKLNTEKKSVAGQKENVMSGAVLSALKDFCRQDAEFAQAVVQGGCFADCMKKVAAGVGNSISIWMPIRRRFNSISPAQRSECS